VRWQPVALDGASNGLPSVRQQVDRNVPNPDVQIRPSAARGFKVQIRPVSETSLAADLHFTVSRSSNGTSGTGPTPFRHQNGRAVNARRSNPRSRPGLQVRNQRDAS
jgi:hypothetical protein